MKKVYSIAKQRLVADILTRFMFCRNLEEVYRTWDELYNEYDLFTDPFTNCPVDRDEYARNCLEYERQVMFDKYGHCDGLE